MDNVTVHDIARKLEAWAPRPLALDYDNVGLQVGHPDREVRRVLVALDLVPAVIEEAESLKAELIVTHHPLIFRGLKRLTPDDPAGRWVLRLAEAGIAYYAAHTNLDAVPGGVSFALAEQLGLENVRLLDGYPGTTRKLVTFVPPDHAEAVRAALAEAGAGRIGDYEACAFETPGTGSFRPLAGATPVSGTPEGTLERADEIRLEVEVERWNVDRAVAALRQAHPYEEVAYDVVPVEQPSTRYGLGAWGVRPEAQPLQEFLEHVSSRLEAGSLRYAGDPKALVRTVAVCGGAGVDALSAARRVGADAYVTADVTYHRFFEPLGPDGSPQMALVDAGHYETEWITEPLLVGWLQSRFPGLDVHRTRHRTSPMRTFVPEG